MQLPHSVPRIGLAVRLTTVLAIMVGLLGMHVLMSPASHSAHDSRAAATAADRMTDATTTALASGAHVTTMAPDTAPTARSHQAAQGICADGCADPGDGSAPGVWAVICVLALLSALLLVLRRSSSWLLAWRELRRAASACAQAVDRAPRHPPSLIVLSISRT